MSAVPANPADPARKRVSPQSEEQRNLALIRNQTSLRTMRVENGFTISKPDGSIYAAAGQNGDPLEDMLNHIRAFYTNVTTGGQNV